MQLGYLVQFITLGQVNTTNGFVRTMGWSWCYSLGAYQPANGDKVALYNGFAVNVLTPLFNQLNNAWGNGKTYTYFPNRLPDTPLQTQGGQGGLMAGARLPLHQAIYCHPLVSSRGHAFVGSKRIGPVNVADVTGDELNAGGFAAWQTALAGYSTAYMFLGVDGLMHQANPCVWSRRLTGSPIVNGSAIGDIIVGQVVNHTLSTWRHRRERAVS